MRRNLSSALNYRFHVHCCSFRSLLRALRSVLGPSSVVVVATPIHEKKDGWVYHKRDVVLAKRWTNLDEYGCSRAATFPRHSQSLLVGVESLNRQLFMCMPILLDGTRFTQRVPNGVFLVVFVRNRSYLKARRAPFQR